MKIIKVLGSEKMYLMSDGSKRPFDYKKQVMNEILETVTIDEAVQVLQGKKKRKNKKA